MSLVSASFFLFLLCILILYYVIPKKYQWWILLAASIAFFGFVGNPWTIVYPVLSVIVTWFCSERIEKSKNNSSKKSGKGWLIAGISVNMGILAVLKYSDFVLLNAGRICSFVIHKDVNWSLNAVASLGISFYTLQIVGYLADCYWGIAKPQKNICKLALFTMFFPQMVSGPINRYNPLSEQLFCEHKFKWDNIRCGVTRIIMGTFKKLVLAENIAQAVPLLLDETKGKTGPVAFLGMICYVIQIYSDFDGCMDIVIGSAQCFDITITENFNLPFLSRSIQEFWQRWHITLGLWLRDYVMYPLLRSGAWKKLTTFCKKSFGKKVAKKIPTHMAMLILWLCMGLWHGGWWNFIFEGVWFWAVIVAGEWLAPIFKKITSKFNTESSLWIWFQRFRTLIIYSAGSIMFKRNSVSGSIRLLRIIYSPLWISNLDNINLLIKSLVDNNGEVNLILHALLIIISFSAFVFEKHLQSKGKGFPELLKDKPVPFRIMCLCIIVYFILIFGIYGPGYNATDFIYGGF